MRGSRAVGGPDGDRRHGPVGPADGGKAAGRPTGQAGLPPGIAGIHPRLCPARQVGTAYGLGCPRAARHSDRRTCHKRLSRAPPLLALTLHKSGFRGSFSLSARKSVLEGQANTVVRSRACRSPAPGRCLHCSLPAILAELAPEFGDGKVFRPNRHVRFSTDKSPYKSTSEPSSLPAIGTAG